MLTTLELRNDISQLITLGREEGKMRWKSPDGHQPTI